MKKTYHIVLTLLFFVNIQAQDSLYLIDILVGKGSGLNERLYNANGLGDINGDGYSDFMVDSGDSTRIYLGNPEFKLKANIVFSGRKSIFPLGDVNNDGYDDFILSKTFYYGSSIFDTSNAIPFDWPTHYYREMISDKVGDIGDVNGDGYKDFAISSPYNWTNGYSFVWLYLGGDSVTAEPFVTFYNSPFEEGNSEGSFGTAVSGIGDVNNDGYDDILISDPKYKDTTNGRYGKVNLYYGGAEMDNVVDTVLTDSSGGSVLSLEMIRAKTKIYDITSNLIIRSYCVIQFYNSKTEKLRIYAGKFGLGGKISIAAGGDLNNDGYNDFIIGNTNHRNDDSVMVGGAFIFYGNSDTLYDFRLEGEHKWDQFGYETDFIGDYNGDGYDDFIILAPMYPDYRDQNQKGKIYIYSYKNIVSVKANETLNIKKYELHQNYPNPFNPSTTIKYTIPMLETLQAASQPVQLKVYDVLGKEVATLVNKPQKAGNYQVEFNAKNLSSGIYYYQLRSGKFTETKKMILLR